MCIRDRCEAAAYYKTKNMTLWDAMIAMYDRYGYYKDDVKSITLKGIEGLAKIQAVSYTHLDVYKRQGIRPAPFLSKLQYGTN